MITTLKKKKNDKTIFKLRLCEARRTKKCRYGEKERRKIISNKVRMLLNTTRKDHDNFSIYSNAI